MSYISDFKSAPISLFGTNGGMTSNDASISTQVGTEWKSSDGRTFVLVQNAATAIASGLMVQGPANLASFVTLAMVGTPAIGATQVTVTLGGTAVVANEFAGGTLIISTLTGVGQTLKIASHPAQSSTSGNVVLTLEDPLSVALDATSTATLNLPQYGSQNGTAASNTIGALGVIVNPTTTSGRILGATLYPIPASSTTVPSYGFIQTKGAIGVLNQGSTAIGLDLMPSASVAGALCTYVVATKTRVGTSPIAGVDGAVSLITLQL